MIVHENADQHYDVHLFYRDDDPVEEELFDVAVGFRKYFLASVTGYSPYKDNKGNPKRHQDVDDQGRAHIDCIVCRLVAECIEIDCQRVRVCNVKGRRDLVIEVEKLPKDIISCKFENFWVENLGVGRGVKVDKLFVYYDLKVLNHWKDLIKASYKA